MTLSEREFMKSPVLVVSRMQSPQDGSDCQHVDEVRDDLYRRAVKMWTKRKPFRILVIAVDEAVAKLEAEVLLNCDRCFALSNISRVWFLPLKRLRLVEGIFVRFILILRRTPD